MSKKRNRSQKHARKYGGEIPQGSQKPRTRAKKVTTRCNLAPRMSSTVHPSAVTFNYDNVGWRVDI